jgi:hypothetical protein
LLVVDGKSNQSAVDEKDDSGFAGTGGAVAGNDCRRNGGNFFTFGRSKEFPFLSFGGCDCVVGMLGRSDNGWPVSRSPSGPEGGKTT